MADHHSQNSNSDSHIDNHISTADSETASLLPLKDTNVLSLRSIEDGGSDFEDVELRSSSFWTRLLMSLRKRRGIRSAEHQPLKLADDKDVSRAKSWRRQHKCCKGFIGVLVGILCFFGITHLINIALAFVHPLWDDQQVIPGSWKLDSAHLDPALLANLTRDVQPIRCHSHNDYWRRIPLYEALRYGCTGVEADVWLFDDDLFVGHSTHALQADRTFRSMYVDPLVQLLDQQNAPNRFTDPSSKTINGIFQTKPSQTVVLLVDFKNNGHDIYPYVSAQLSALRSKNYLTYTDGTTTHYGPITVVATGNAPFDLINAPTSRRDIFFDAPLDRLYETPVSPDYLYASAPPELLSLSSSPDPSASTSTSTSTSPSLTLSKRTAHAHAHAGANQGTGQGTVGTTPSSTFNTTNSYYASVSFSSSIGTLWFGKISSSQIQLIRGQIQGAKRRGLKPRYWATPKWPISLRNHVWDVLVQEGVEYLNGDDLEGMTRGDWGVKRHRWWLGG